jgi:ubiquinone/menaquinone biosynthesis C-methylase UbiE
MHGAVAASFCAARSGSVAFDNYDKEAKKLGDLMSWKPGEVIAEIGAGESQMSFAAAVRVGLGGRVYSTELDGTRLGHLGRRSLAESCRM